MTIKLNEESLKAGAKHLCIAKEAFGAAVKIYLQNELERMGGSKFGGIIGEIATLMNAELEKVKCDVSTIESEMIVERILRALGLVDNEVV